MKRPTKQLATWRSALWAAAICVVVGLALLRWSNGLVLLSYDLLFFLKVVQDRALPTRPPQDAIIVYMNDDAFSKLGQVESANWDRSIHARLVDKLTMEQARVVVFDIVFESTNGPSADAELIRAVRRNGRVVLAASQGKEVRNQVVTKSVVRPFDALMDAAAGWGIAGVYQAAVEGRVAREYHVGNEILPSLPWVAARVAGAPITLRPGASQPTNYLNYYGPPFTLPAVGYMEALTNYGGLFRDKCVFIGVHLSTQRGLDQVDTFDTPYSVLDSVRAPGVEILATAFLNLLRGDGMRKMAWAGQTGIVLLVGLVFGAGLTRLRPRWAPVGALAGIFLIVVLAVECAKREIWFAWTIPVFVQIPVALACSIGGLYLRLRFERDVLTRTLEETTRLVEATKLTAHRPAQLVPDHELVRLVGKGAYGEVWLAKNAIGVFHAVKIVRRAAFPSDVPYEREFRGIQKFMPVSRTHEGLVHVLHVGRNETERCFYCIMEAGDDQTTGQKIDPETYVPKSLASELKWRGRLSPEETLHLGVALATALDHLHDHQLIHRDIKPGNIIYVHGHPKFADIGLVTEMAGEGRDVSFLGTQGYIPPEGPGTSGADVYALGKVLYEAAMGRDREFFPEVPTAVYEEPEDSLLRQLQQVIFRACESNAADRYRTAGELRAALEGLMKGRKGSDNETQTQTAT
jgi:CHASE2 domain-containing sensor protein